MANKSSRKTKKKKNPCFPPKGKEKEGLKYLNSKECIKAQIRDNPWMLKKGGDKMVGKGPLLDEIKRVKKKKRKKINQSGGFAPCIPCMAPVLSGLGLLGAGTAAAAGGVAISSSVKNSTSSSVINGKVTRKKDFESKVKKGKKTKKIKYTVSQKDKLVTYKEGKKTIKKKFKDIKKANSYYNKMITSCKQKCKKNSKK